MSKNKFVMGLVYLIIANSVIKNLVDILRDTCEAIHGLSGWSTLAITGGPNPSMNGKVSLQT